MNEIEQNIRFYLGRHKIRLIEQFGRKVIIEHLEKGYVGTIKTGYKNVVPHDQDITLIRLCWKDHK